MSSFPSTSVTYEVWRSHLRGKAGLRLYGPALKPSAESYLAACLSEAKEGGYADSFEFFLVRVTKQREKV